MQKTKKVSLFLILFISIFTKALAGGTTYFGIEIIGDVEFIVQVSGALEVIEAKAPQEFSLIKQYIGRIRQGERDEMDAHNIPLTLTLNDTTVFYSSTWCAGSIAHDAYHSKLHNDYKESHGEPVPDNAWTMLAAEKKSLKYQIEVMRKINAPPEEIKEAELIDLTKLSAREVIYSGIDIIGDEKFIAQVSKALGVVEALSPQDFSFIKRYIGKIEQSERSGMVSDDIPPKFKLADRTAFHSVTWCAGSIAHDAYHSKLYDDYKKVHGAPGHDSNWTLQKEEKECLKY